MKKNNKFLFPVACAFLLSSSVVYGSCKDVSGTINSISLPPDGASQVGMVEVVYDGTGKSEICASHGQITGPGTMAHLFVCNGGSITTEDVVVAAPIGGCGDDTGYILGVTEESVITGGSKKYNNASGGFVTTGTVNTCTGENSFTFAGELCLSED